MKGHFGRSCKITIDKNGKELIYSNCNITNIDPAHITFTDKYGDLYSFRKSDVSQIKND